MRVLYLVHGHPQFSVGGAENAAFSLFQELHLHVEIETWILAAVHTSRGVLQHGEIRSMDGSDREYLIGTSCDWLLFSNADIISMKRSLQRLLDHIDPDIIHLQHYMHFGIDIVPLLQSLCPSARIIITLHEYLALCRHNGQMVTTNQLKLCERSTPLSCSMCFPEQSTADFFLRFHYIKTILESCDALISPSHFLIERYRDCSITHPCFVMIENGLPSVFDEQCYSPKDSFSPSLNRFGFFGQLNQYKGILVLLKAVSILKSETADQFIINVYGANLENQPDEFQEAFSQLYEEVSDRVALRGTYRQNELENLMHENDWTVVPSIWWENSPVVIQESFFYARPVIGSNIGGIAEKIIGHGGFTFTAGSESSLAYAMHKAISNVPLHQSLVRQMSSPTTSRKCAKLHIALYEKLASLSSSR